MILLQDVYFLVQNCILHFYAYQALNFLGHAMFIDIEMIIVRKICHSVQSNAILNVVHPVTQT